MYVCDDSNTSTCVHDKSTDTLAMFIIYKECQLDTCNNAGTCGVSKLQVHRSFRAHGYMRPQLRYSIVLCWKLEAMQHPGFPTR